MLELVLGTGNAHKAIEMRQMLPQGRIRILSIADLPDPIDVDETGCTFAENARLKATVQARHLGRWVLAEDSGLCVDALNGRPGVHSARFAGQHGADEANNLLLLKELDSVPTDRRGAAFHCHACLADPSGRVRIESAGSCRGVIAMSKIGEGGFGYDPLFVIPEYHQTFAELGSAVKNVLSHRSRALRVIVPRLIDVMTTSTRQYPA